MSHELTTLLNSTHSLTNKVAFLSNPETYPETTAVEVLETHMSWVFLTDHFVYKLKKPVCYDFLDFRTLDLRYVYCKEEIRVNQSLAPDVYLGVVPIILRNNMLQLEGEGETIDWLVKMKRLPKEHFLHTAILEGTMRNERVKQAAEKLVDFYLTSSAIKIDPHTFRQQIVKEIELNNRELLRKEFSLQTSLIVGIAIDLLRFMADQSDLVTARISDGRIVDGHGDLRPEHICIAPTPVIIDRVEFNSNLRILDVAEELSFLALECEMLGSAAGQLFFHVYKWRSHDKIPDILVSFYKAKRAFLRAKLSIHHLLEKKYRINEQKWKDRCNAYLRVADFYCEKIQKARR
jgi:aminoglycoside phosphotransferase family enzyme